MIFRFKRPDIAIRILFLTFAISNIAQYILRHHYADRPWGDFAQGTAVGVGIAAILIAAVLISRQKNSACRMWGSRE